MVSKTGPSCSGSAEIFLSLFSFRLAKYVEKAVSRGPLGRPSSLPKAVKCWGTAATNPQQSRELESFDAIKSLPDQQLPETAFLQVLGLPTCSCSTQWKDAAWEKGRHKCLETAASSVCCLSGKESRKYIYIYIYIYIYKYIYIYMCVCVCVCICIYIYTYISLYNNHIICMYVWKANGILGCTAKVLQCGDFADRPGLMAQVPGEQGPYLCRLLPELHS